MPISTDVFQTNRQRAIDCLNTCEQLYVVDGFVGWDVRYRLKVRIICQRPYHALFMHNMMIRPTAEELADFGEPEFVLFNAGTFTADSTLEGLTSDASVNLNFESREMVVLGSQYAGEMKKGIFTVMNYLMPKQGVLSMHCSANQGTNSKDQEEDNDVSIFFGLSGTGKTTLSADPHRGLIGDDEHIWSDDGVANIEGGCYAKCLDLSAEKEPQIYSAIRFGTVLENTVCDPVTREVDYHDSSLTENTRASYPVEFIPNAVIPCVGGHPNHIILLTCDATGILPPVSRLTPEQTMYHFISGYTAKVAGTEVGISEPVPSFSACFGSAFLIWHPAKYAELLAEKMRKHHSQAWLVNTGWTAGPYGIGQRIPLAYTRAIINAIHSGELANAPVQEDPVFGLSMIAECTGCPSEILTPRNTWSDKAAYDAAASRLTQSFHENFAQFAEGCSKAIRNAGPKQPVST